MDKRFFLALLLTAIVVVATPFMFPGSTRRPAVTIGAPDSTGRTTAARRTDSAAARSPSVAGASVTAAPGQPAASAAMAAPVETTTVHPLRATYAFTSRGGAPLYVSLDSYPTLRAGPRHSAIVGQPTGPLARYRLAMGRDTIALDTIPLQAETQGVASAAPQLGYGGMAAGHQVHLAYQFVPDSFIVRLRATVADAPAGSSLLVDLPRSLVSNEADTLGDLQHLALGFRTPRGDVTNVPFSKVDSAETRVQAGPLTWVATRSKYFLVAYRTEPKTPFSAIRYTGMPRRGKLAPDLVATAALPLTGGGATVDLYTGPQDPRRLQALGSDLDEVNQYAGIAILRGIVQPFATIVVNVLLWVKRTTQLNYGWVLVLFAIAIRLALWIPNQGALRTSMKMQRLQPELQAIQTRYKDDPKRQQDAIMKVYKDHGMSPLSPLMGCLPMLLPMPILFALYHVFQNTIEFRGVPFLWLPDLSQADPFYITPLLMGATMFLMSSISLRATPPGPQAAQAKMMAYVMPVMMTFFFYRFAAGLNLYYAVQNLAAIPQTWMISRERAKNVPVTVMKGPGPELKRRS